MRRRLVFAAALVIGACGGAPEATTLTLTVKDYKFPPSVTAPAGSQIDLVNGDDEGHTVTADDESFDSGPFRKGEQKHMTAPAKAGSYPFHCQIHPTLKSTLVVE